LRYICSGAALYRKHSCKNSHLLVFALKCTYKLIERALATSIVVGSSIIGAGFGFAVPTLVVSEESKG